VAPTTYTVHGELWRHPGGGGWHVVTLPGDVADDVRARTAAAPRPFGTVRVRATLGRTSWSTSLFADTSAASYLLPVKAGVRRRERVAAGDVVDVALALEGS
jgi:hypothetical protein